MAPAATAAALSLDAVSNLSREIAAEVDSRLSVMGVASTDRESGRVEILVSVRGCHGDPCVLMLNVTRLGRAAFDRDVRAALKHALLTHVTAA